MPCKWERIVTDWVDYGSTRVPMESLDCQYNGYADISLDCDCGPKCPGYEESVDDRICDGYNED